MPATAEPALKNVTITLDEKTASWVRMHAARHGTSVSRIVGEMLQEKMRANRDYDSAMRRFLSKAPKPMTAPDGSLPAREDLHDRAGLR